MTASDDAVGPSYRFCRQLTRHAGSSFAGGFFLLPAEKRPAMTALYAFMRHTDDLADSPEASPLRRELLTAWRADFEQALLGRLEVAGTRPLSFLWSDRMEDRDGRAILPALADTVHRYHIPPEHLRAVIDGVEMDLDRRRYATFDELSEYCLRVASAVGLACICVWGFRGEEAFEPARSCGLALQLTNILRDVREDAEQDRIYLPLADLAQCGLTESDLVSCVADERFDRLVRLEIDRAEELYAKAAELMHYLEPDGRRLFGMMTSMYHALLRRIAQRPRDVLTRRVRVSRREKLCIAARWTLLPPSAAALL